MSERKSESDSTKHWQYSQEDINAIYELMNRCHASQAEPYIHIQQGFVRANLIWSDKKGKYEKPPIGHWEPDEADAKSKKTGWFAHSCYSPLSDQYIRNHIVYPNKILGLVPSYILCCILDVDDYKSDNTMFEVVEKYGQPLLIYPSGSGGHHIIYPVPSWDEAMKIGGAKYCINGKEIGETASGGRWACMWSPINILKAYEARIALNDLPSEEVNWITEERIERLPETKREKRTPAVQLHSGEGVTAGMIIEEYDLEYNPQTKRYMGACPVCASENNGDGGATRFNLIEGAGGLSGTDFRIQCWAGAASHNNRAFNSEQWKLIMKPIWAKMEKRHKPQSQVSRKDIWAKRSLD